MSTSPEAATPEAKPKYSPEDLRDGTKVDNILEEYGDPDEKSSTEIDELVQRGLRDGVFRRNAGEDIRLDDTFAGAEVVPVNPDATLEDYLGKMKSRKQEMMREEHYNAVKTELGELEPDQQVDRLAFLVEQDLRRGDIDISEPKAAQAAKPGRAARPASGGKPALPAVAPTPGVPASPSKFIPADRRQFAHAEALGRIVQDLDPDHQTKFQEKLNELGKRKSEILKDEASRKTRAKVIAREESEQRAAEARQRIEAATLKTEATEQERTLGLNREELKKGTKVDNPHPEAIASGIVRKDGTLRKDVEVTSSVVHEAALKENERFDLERQHGREGAEKILAERERVARVEGQIEGARAAAARTGEDISNFGPSGARRLDNTPEVQAEAWAADYEARALRDLSEHYGRLIESQPDMIFKQELSKERDTAISAERERLKKFREEAARVAGETRTHARNGEQSESRIGAEDPKAEEKAEAVHMSLGLEPVPFLEVKKGGLFHRRKNRGPKVVEAYFRVPGNDNIVVLERRRRRSGDLLSQTVMTTTDPIRKRGVVINLPPREINGKVEEAREKDRTYLVDKANGPVSKWLGGSISPGDYANWGLGSGKKIDGGFDSHAGIYAEKYHATSSQLNKFKYGGKRRGGFFYWMSGGKL